MSDFWDALRATTQARIGQDRTGDTIPTSEVVGFRTAHALARDAVREPLDVDALAAGVAELGLGDTAVVTSQAADRGEYLRRPDLGRRAADLSPVPAGSADIGFVLADGLSTKALADHAAPMLRALVAAFEGRLTMAAPVIATQARVGLGDHIGEALGVTTLLVLIGERPGLSVADSLGIYLTHRPRPGRRDSERNCISNIHPPEGLGYAQAARIAAALVDGARLLGESGVRLKDSSHTLTS